MKSKRIKLLKFSGIMLVSLLSLLTVASCGSTEGSGTGGDILTVATSLTLNCSSTSIYVGDTTTVSVANPVEGASYIFISSDESIATVTDNGVVTGVKQGSVTISVYQQDDFSVTGSVSISVFNAVSSGDEVSQITLDTTNAKLVFSMTEEFSTDGLVVYVDGVVVTDYSTNPTVGTLLTTSGENTVYVSYTGAESVSYTITVVPAEDDTSLVDYVTALNEASTYTYSIVIDGSVQLEDDSVVSGLSYTYQFGETAYFLETIAGNQPYAEYTYGYVNTDKGVMKYTVEDEIAYPICYTSHQYTNYQSLSLNTYQGLSASSMPTRKIGEYFSITDSTAVAYLTSVSRTNVSSVSSYVRTIKAYLEGDVLSFVLDCGTYGTITLIYSDIDNTTPKYIDDYLERYGTDVEIYDDVERAKELFAMNNFTYSLGSSVGTVYVTENYVYYDYLDSYLESYNDALEEGASQLTDYGYFSFGGEVYYFQAMNNYLITGSVDGVYDLTEGETFMDFASIFPSTLTMFNDNIDMFEPTTVTISSYTYDSYEIQYDDIPDEVFEFYGYTASVYVIPYSTGFVLADSSIDSSAQVLLYVGYTSLAMSTGYTGLVFTNFGNANVTFIDELLASLS